MVSKASDFVVEVRNTAFARQGQIDPTYLDLMWTEVFRGVGRWTLKLPSEHPQLAQLKARGGGIIITDRVSGRVYSGRVTTAQLSQDPTDPDGTWQIDGVDDGVVAQATIALPDPLNDPTAQTAAYYELSGSGETVMKTLVRRNAGDLAIASRKYAWLTAAADLARGSAVSVSARFQNLGELLTAVGLRAGLGWSFYQSGAGVVFDVYAPQDKTALVRLDVRNGGLESSELGWSAPTATDVLVLGQGEGADRQVVKVNTPESLAAAVDWGLRWEQVKDQRNTNDPTELTQAGQEVLAEEGVTINRLQVQPSDAPNQRLGLDWWLGDKITVVVDGQPTQAIVAEVASSISSAGVIRQATVGDPVGFDWEAKIGARVQQQEERLDKLEATVEAGDYQPAGNYSVVGHTHTGAEVTAATSAARGTVELATTTEAAAGTDTTRAVTPAGVAAALGADGGLRYVSTITFEASGTFTKATYPWLKAVRVRVQAAGGAGGGAVAAAAGQHSSGGGGGGGGYAEGTILAAALAASETVTLGAPGTGVSGGTGTNAAQSSFGAHVVATGGQGGTFSGSTALMVGAFAGIGGVGTAGQILVAGQPGMVGMGNATLGHGGSGGGSMLGAGARGTYTGAGGGSQTGGPGREYGGGGAGAMTNAGAASSYSGGAGAPGIIIVDLYA